MINLIVEFCHSHIIHRELCQYVCICITFVGSGSLGNDPSKVNDKDAAKGPDGIPSLPAIHKRPAVAAKPTTSGSSRDQTDDEEAEGETDMTESMDPTDAKRVRRYCELVYLLLRLFLETLDLYVYI